MGIRRKSTCEKKGCRKKHVDDSIYCAAHEEAAHPEDAAMKCTREQALQFQALDAEYKLKLQAIANVELQGENARLRYDNECRKRSEEKTAHLIEAERIRREYESLVKDIAQPHNLDPRKMTIDPDTCILRDLRDGPLTN
jgi:hypothetical protein